VTSQISSQLSSRARQGPGPARPSAAERQPKYLQIHARLHDRISSGQWPVGSSLPSQRELADEFGVSLMTLRQAVALLIDDGLVDTRHGSGTYVAARYSYDLGHLRSFATDLAAQGAEITTRLLAAQTVAPPEPVSARLGGPAEVLRLRRLRLVGGRPLILQTSYLPVPLLPDALTAAIGRGDLGLRGLYTILAEHGLAVTRASETITPTALGQQDASDLGRPEASLALLSHRISFTVTGEAVIDDHALLPGDSVAITANRSAEHLEVRYTLTTGP
jgi:GntR family transcriptional regulator